MFQDDWSTGNHIYRSYRPHEELCPLSLQEFFFRALENDPALRPSAHEAAAELQKILEA